jgi:hypothetical protein
MAMSPAAFVTVLDSSSPLVIFWACARPALEPNVTASAATMNAFGCGFNLSASFFASSNLLAYKSAKARLFLKPMFCTCCSVSLRYSAIASFIQFCIPGVTLRLVVVFQKYSQVACNCRVIGIPLLGGTEGLGGAGEVAAATHFSPDRVELKDFRQGLLCQGGFRLKLDRFSSFFTRRFPMPACNR